LRWLLILVIASILLSGCSYQINGVEFATISDTEVSFDLDIGADETVPSNKCSFSGDFGLTDYDYMELATVIDGEAREIVVDVINRTVTYDNTTHDYLRNKSFVNGVEVEDVVDVIDWPVMDFESVDDAWRLLIADYPIEAGCVGEVQDGYEYYIQTRPASDDSFTGAIPDRLGTEEYTYIFKDGQVVSLAIDVSYFVEDVEYHTQLSVQILNLK